MDLTSPKIIKELLSKYNARPSKGLGQNFLIDKNVLNKIIEASDIKPSDVILEVGPGIGTLTQELAKKAKKVIAIEKDKVMIEILKETLKDSKNIEIIQGDILKNKLSLPKKYKIVANIPYYLTSPLIRKFLESENQPEEMVLMLQKEVAQRICSKPPRMSLLAVSVQFYADAKIVSYVSKNCFWPAPKIDSAIIKIHPVKSPEGRILAKPKLFNGVNSQLFFKVVKAGFSQPRKQLAGNLSKMLKLSREKTNSWLLKNNIAPTQRAETLSVEDWKNLANSL
ncbi:MAG: 16S rRNA (adenine(1518)-N(6)/adenine(1519)-N(6))-dimethyltransferase RsmA [Candidatus Staskawiczbacteria bacterium]|nr:16S rRNA (adenine(1518)-N(6)/adenine(1519)-N(6))-dimethyltransferase RsmA [Candidatus Staskawiczbacteria bacterium]